MSSKKTVRLEVRLPEKMLKQIRDLAPVDKNGRPNTSEFVREALQREIRSLTTRNMVEWAQRHSDVLKDVDKE